MDTSFLTQLIEKTPVVSRAIVNSIESFQTGGVAFLTVSLLPRKQLKQATLAFPYLSSGGTVSLLPKPGDLVLVFRNTDAEEYYCLGALSSPQQPYDMDILDGSLCLQAEKIRLGKNADEPIVLGNVLQQLLLGMSDTLQGILQLLQDGIFVLTTAPGVPTAPNPNTAALISDLIADVTQYTNDLIDAPATNILSQQSFAKREPL